MVQVFKGDIGVYRVWGLGSKYPIIRYLGFEISAILVQLLGKYMILRYLDPLG